MRLVRLGFVLIILIAVSACADIVPLTGGARDSVAPKPVKSDPVTGETYANPQKATITFDEYITLQDPATTITMSPEVGPLKAEMNKKTLTVSWSHILLPETTYILNLNGTVRDLNEGNDSIIQVVFSTGQFIDSLSHKGNITSAYSGEFIQNATICLFSPDSVPFVNKPTYFTRSDRGGNYSFNYLKKQSYTLFAFQDQNKNQEIDPTENIAFQVEKIDPTDTLLSKLRLFKPKTTAGKLKINIDKPGIITASGIDFRQNPLYLEDQPLEVIEEIRFDSIRTILPGIESGRYVFHAGTDTLIRLHPYKDRTASFLIKSTNPKQWKANDTLVFSGNEYFQTFNEANFTIQTESNKPVSYQHEIKNGKLYILPNTQENFNIHFGKDAVAGSLSKNDTLSLNFETFIADRCGNLSLDMSDFDSTWIVELINNKNTELGKVVAKRRVVPGKMLFTTLIPGEYSARCFHDENGNGVWDSGDYEKLVQPETMLRFLIPQKVRANWDIEEKFVLE